MSIDVLQSKSSGSVQVEEQIDESPSKLLTSCLGGCGKKILYFGESSDDPKTNSLNMLCLECRSAPLKNKDEEPKPVFKRKKR